MEPGAGPAGTRATPAPGTLRSSSEEAEKNQVRCFLLMCTILKGKTLLDVVSSAARITLRVGARGHRPGQSWTAPGRPAVGGQTSSETRRASWWGHWAELSHSAHLYHLCPASALGLFVGGPPNLGLPLPARDLGSCSGVHQGLVRALRVLMGWTIPKGTAAPAPWAWYSLAGTHLRLESSVWGRGTALPRGPQCLHAAHGPVTNPLPDPTRVQGHLKGTAMAEAKLQMRDLDIPAVSQMPHHPPRPERLGPAAADKPQLGGVSPRILLCRTPRPRRTRQ